MELPGIVPRCGGEIAVWDAEGGGGIPDGRPYRLGTSAARAAISVSDRAGRSTPPSSRAPNAASAINRRQRRAPSTAAEGFPFKTCA